MEFSDISARFRQQREPEAPTEATPFDFDESYRLRARMVGVLLRDARLHARRTIEECAHVLRVEPSRVEAWEFGSETPSLPQLELLANYLDVPVSQFWSANTLKEPDAPQPDSQREYLALRDRMIGVLLRQAREDGGLAVEALAEKCGVAASDIERYELGEDSVPLHVLAVLANGVNKNISYFLESSSHIGDLLALREAWKTFSELPEGLRRFVANPLNVGFLEIARMFSQMPADKLRKVGESFLDITM